MSKEAKIKMFVLSTSQYKQDESLNLDGVENSIDLLNSSANQIADIDIFSNLESTVAKENLLKYFQTNNFTETEIFMFYFCGHGFLIGNNLNTLLLATSDTTYSNSTAEVGIKFDWLLSEIKRNLNPHKYIIILDCCHSAIAGNMGATWIDNVNLENYSGAVIITSTQTPSQCAKVIDVNGIKHAAFTYYFSTALQDLVNSSKTFTLSDMMKKTVELIKHANPAYSIPTPKIKSVNEMEDMIKFNTYNPEQDIIANDNNKLKVLLVKTAIDFPIKDYDFGVPLGIWLLKSYMFIQGLDAQIDIFDERLLKVKGEEADFEDVVSHYDIVGVSICTCEVPQAIKKLNIAKKYGAITFVGGIFTSTNEEYLFKQGCIDYIIPGVSTLPLYNLFKEIHKTKNKPQNSNSETSKTERISHISGVATKDNFADSFSLWTPCHLPHIELTIWNEICKKYSAVLNGKIDIFTARGCANRCAFCSVQKECNQKVLERDDDSIIDEINFLVNAGFIHFSIKDEDFFMRGSDRLLNIIKQAHAMHPEITFKIRTRIDEIMGNENIELKDLYEFGVREIQYGLETPDPNLLAKIKKGYRYENTEVIDFIKKTIQTGIVANCSFILGIDGESEQYYKSLISFFGELESFKDKLKVYINFITPHPYKNTFPLEDYQIITNDLKYFTHKNPIAFPKKMKRITRKEMIVTYNKIVAMFDPEHKYNPVISKEIREKFLNGNNAAKSLPNYYEGKI